MFCAAEGLPYSDLNLPTPVETFVAYGDAFQRRFAPQLDTRLAREIRATPGCFQIELEDGAVYRVRACVVATGLSDFEATPEPLRTLSPARAMHSADPADYARFRDKRVLVVGAGPRRPTPPARCCASAPGRR